jgi:hypothetical protein
VLARQQQEVAALKVGRAAGDAGCKAKRERWLDDGAVVCVLRRCMRSSGGRSGRGETAAVAIAGLLSSTIYIWTHRFAVLLKHVLNPSLIDNVRLSGRSGQAFWVDERMGLSMCVTDVVDVSGQD